MTKTTARAAAVPTIAIASGKGGTGKTLVATNLAYVASRSLQVVLADLDVEEPNCRLFFAAKVDASEAVHTMIPVDDASEAVRTMIPVVDELGCGRCGVCGAICEYNAIVNLPAKVLVFPELCHGCYGCLEMCPAHAITEGSMLIGHTHAVRVGSLDLVSGELAIGQPSTTPLIAATKKRVRTVASFGNGPAGNASYAIYDAPPGTSCPVVEAVKDANYVLLVGEPTRFGLHDLDLMTQTVTALGKPMGVVVNKAVDGNRDVEDYCAGHGIEVIQRIPWRRDIAHESARGRLVAETLPDVRELFEEMLDVMRGRLADVSA